jgi:hypothetical protein
VNGASPRAVRAGRERDVERLAHVDDPEHTIARTGFEPRATQSL